METGFELFDHTADLGIRIFAPTREALLLPAVQGLYAAIGELAGQPSHTDGRANWIFTGPDPAALLRDFLQMTLLEFEHDQQVIVSTACREFTDLRLCVDVVLSPLDTATSVFYREVKAITYHELALEKTPTGFEARVIVDI